VVQQFAAQLRIPYCVRKSNRKDRTLVDNLPPADEWNDTAEESGEVEDRAAESLSQLADVLTRVSQQHSQAEELNRSIVQIKDTMTEAIVAFSSLAQSTIETEGRLQATAEKLEASVERLAVREQNILGALDAHVKRFTTFLVWTLLLASFAAAAAAISILFSLLKAR
jgi:predicted  nucleic acid-binding Zn-ribbon protein